MISRMEAHKYLRSPKLTIDLDRYHVFAGANGAGQSAQLDVLALIGDMLGRRSIAGAFREQLRAWFPEH
jgi:predicted ATPase